MTVMTEDRPFVTVSYYNPEHRLNVSVVSDKILFSGTPQYGGSLVLLSVLGPHSAVRGILAAAVSRRELRCSGYPTAQFYGSEGARILTLALSREVTHGVYLAPQLLLGSSERIAILEDTPQKVYDRLTHAFAIPALPEWADWMVKALKAENQLTPLAGKGASGSSIATSEESLDALISKGLKEGAIRF